MHTVILDTTQQNSRRISDFISEKYPGWNVNAYPTTFALATAVYDEFKGDVDLLMIHVDADRKSIELAKDLQDYFPNIRIVFYSENTECAEEIFKAVPTYFLKLPFQEQYLKMALERVRMGVEEDIGRTLVLQSHGQKQKIRFSAIRYIESIGRKLLLYTDDGSFETYMTVEDAMAKLPQQFVQCHRSYIVNLNRVEKYSTEGMLLANGELVPISRTYQKKMKELLTMER